MSEQAESDRRGCEPLWWLQFCSFLLWLVNLHLLVQYLPYKASILASQAPSQASEPSYCAALSKDCHMESG